MDDLPPDGSRRPSGSARQAPWSVRQSYTARSSKGISATERAQLRGEKESLRSGPVCRCAPDLLESERVSPEITADLNGVFPPNERLTRAVNQQRCPCSLGGTVAVGAAFLPKCFGYPFRRGDPSGRPRHENASHTKSWTWSYVLDAVWR